MPLTAPAATDPHPRRRIAVAGTEISYVETGAEGPVEIVFLHGNPTSSYLWRNVLPHVAESGRCYAPDLMGMGDSGPAPDASYRFADHAATLDEWFDALGLAAVVVVGHDWGGALGFHWARRHRDRVAAVVYMETIVTPLGWDDWPENARKVFAGFRSPAGEEMILEKNMFVERVLPASVMRTLGPEEMRSYRKPFERPGEGPAPDLDVAARNPDRGGARRRARDRRDLRNLARRGPRGSPRSVRQRRPRQHPGRRPARILPPLAQPDRGSRSPDATSSRRMRRPRSAGQSPASSAPWDRPGRWNGRTSSSSGPASSARPPPSSWPRPASGPSRSTRTPPPATAPPRRRARSSAVYYSTLAGMAFA